MSSIDQRIVSMKFDNAQFEQGIKTTLGSLQTLNSGLKLQGATKGLNDLGVASKNIPLGELAAGVQGIADKFRAMGVAGVTAVTNITNRVVNAGLQLGKSLTVSPVTSGLHEYETTLNSIQTIMANTGLEGKAGLAKVNAALTELNHYSDKTIYNFAEMAKNIGTFTAAGVSLKTSTAAIKGIANLAAVSGSNSLQASTAMNQLSQALAAGKVSLEDWNSVVNAGMGGKVFQEALKETARTHGVAVDKIIKGEGSFRLSLQKGWLTSKVLTETLSKFTGDLSAKQLKSMGYNEKQIAGIIKMGKTAQDAATKVKTMSQLIGTLQEAAGSGWSETWKLVFGDFNEAKKLWTGVNNILGGFINKSAEARNKVLGDWKKLGGRTALIDSISLAFDALLTVLKPIRDAFRQIFPATTGKQLYDMTVALHVFAENLKIGSETANRLKRTFAGVFAVFGIGWEIIKQVAKTLFGLFSEVGKGGNGGFLKTTASIGDFLVALHKALVEGEGLKKFFEGVGKVLAVPIRLIKQLAGYLGSLFSADSSKATKSVSDLKSKLDPMAQLGDKVSAAWNKVVSVFRNIQKVALSLGTKIRDFVSNFGSSTTDGMAKSLDFSSILDSFNTGLFATLVLLVRSFFKNFGKTEGGLVAAIKAPFEQLTKTLGAMQNTLRAATLLEIAAAIAIMAYSVSVLSKIDAEGLTRALTAMTVMFTQLLASMLIFEKLGGTKGFLKMPFVAASMILLSIAVAILASAVKKLADLGWNALAKGLTGLGVILAFLIITMKLMPSGRSMIQTGFGLQVWAAAVKVLASAVTDLSKLSWEDMTRGLIGVGAILVGLALFTKFTKSSRIGLTQSVGLTILAVAIQILAGAIKDLSKLSWGDLAKGLAAMAGGLGIITAALMLIPPTAPLAAAGVLIVAISLGMVADVLQAMGKMSWGEIGKGLTALLGALTIITLALLIIPPTAPLGAAGVLIVALSLGMVADVLKRLSKMSWEEIKKSLITLAGAMLIIAIGVNSMIIALPGAAAMLVVSAALAILAPVLILFGNMSWEQIAKGLLMLAGVFIVIAAGGVILTPVIPTLLLLGAAVATLGAGMLMAGIGMLTFSVALTALSISGAAGTAALVLMVSALAGLIPMIMSQFGVGIIAFAKTLSTAGPAFTIAIVVVLNALITAINIMAPKIITTLYRLLTLLLQTMSKYVPQMVDAGLKLLTGILNGFAKNIGKIVTAGTNLVVQFLNGVANNQPKVLQAAANLIIKFVNGLATTVRNNSAAMGKAGANLASAIIEGMIKGLGSGVGTIASKAADVARGALNAAKHVLGINSPSREFEKIGKYVNDGFVKGLTGGSREEVVKAFNNLKSLLSDAMKTSSLDVDQATAKLKRLTHARHRDNAAIAKARRELSQAKHEHKATSAAYSELTKRLDDERNALGKLANRYGTVAAKIKDALDKLKDAKKTRDDYNQSVRDQYSNLPEVTSNTKLVTYIEGLKKQIEDTQTFATAIQKLRTLGLNDTMYKDLLSKGISALPFVQDILANGKSGVDEINKLDSQLQKVAGTLGMTASTQLYQAGVNAAAGLVKGLANQQAAIEKQMDKIAAAMVKSIKKKLGIKSPSQEFAKLGEYSVQGLAKGLEQTSMIAELSAENVGKGTIESLRKSLSGMSDLVRSDVDMQPTIRPVLDLTNIKKDASQIGSMLTVSPISVDTTLNKAKLAYDGYQQNQVAVTDQALAKKNDGVTFNQYNNSPKALSPATIYRQTKNQLSVAKGALAK